RFSRPPIVARSLTGISARRETSDPHARSRYPRTSTPAKYSSSTSSVSVGEGTLSVIQPREDGSTDGSEAPGGRLSRTIQLASCCATPTASFSPVPVKGWESSCRAAIVTTRPGTPRTSTQPLSSSISVVSNFCRADCKPEGRSRSTLDSQDVHQVESLRQG